MALNIVKNLSSRFTYTNNYLRYSLILLQNMSQFNITKTELIILPASLTPFQCFPLQQTAPLKMKKYGLHLSPLLFLTYFSPTVNIFNFITKMSLKLSSCVYHQHHHHYSPNYHHRWPQPLHRPSHWFPLKHSCS